MARAAGRRRWSSPHAVEGDRPLVRRGVTEFPQKSLELSRADRRWSSPTSRRRLDAPRDRLRSSHRFSVASPARDRAAISMWVPSHPGASSMGPTGRDAGHGGSGLARASVEASGVVTGSGSTNADLPFASKSPRDSARSSSVAGSRGGVVELVELGRTEASDETSRDEDLLPRRPRCLRLLRAEDEETPRGGGRTRPTSAWAR